MAKKSHISSVNPYKESSTCRNGGHSWCSGKRILRYQDGEAVLAKCQCSCHKHPLKKIGF